MPDGISKLPASCHTGVSIQSADLAAGGSSHVMLPTVPTSAGTTEVLIRAPVTGKLASGSVAFSSGLAVDATNTVTFSLINYGQAGAGSANMLATGGGANSTLNSGSGAAITAKVPFTLVVNPANAAVVKGDVLAFRVVGAGTLANTLPEGALLLGYTPS